MKINVVLADDHAVVREGVRAIVEHRAQDIQITAEASTGSEVLALAERNPVDVYVIDISMPVLNGIEVTERLIKKDSKNRIIILSMHDSTAFVDRALKCGAKGYIVKQSAAEEVIHAIREVYKGGTYLSASVTKYIVEGFLHKTVKDAEARKIVKLTRKEREVLQLIAEGIAQKDIAVKLKIAVNTVHVHTNNIMRKLNLHKRADLVRFALREGMIHV